MALVMLTPKQRYNREYYLRRKKKEPNWIKENYAKLQAKLKANPKAYAKMLEKSRIRHRNLYALHKGYAYRRDEKLRESVVNFLGGKCIRCGFSDMRALELDHKNGDGTLDRLRFGSKHSKIARYYSKHLDEAKEKLQVLCANCNKIKAHEEKEYSSEKHVHTLRRFK